MKIGIIGYGKMGQIRAKAVEEYGETIDGIFEPSDDIKHEYKIYDNPSDLIDDMDVIFICTPNH